MQGINRARYIKLLESLLQMERMLQDLDPDGADAQQIATHRQELVMLFTNYQGMLEKLAEQVAAYEALYSQIKINFLVRKLKEFKKEISYEKPGFVMLVENIRLSHGT